MTLYGFEGTEGKSKKKLEKLFNSNPQKGLELIKQSTPPFLKNYLVPKSQWILEDFIGDYPKVQKNMEKMEHVIFNNFKPKENILLIRSCSAVKPYSLSPTFEIVKKLCSSYHMEGGVISYLTIPLELELEYPFRFYQGTMYNYLSKDSYQEDKARVLKRFLDKFTNYSIIIPWLNPVRAKIILDRMIPYFKQRNIDFCEDLLEKFDPKYFPHLKHSTYISRFYSWSAKILDNYVQNKKEIQKREKPVEIDYSDQTKYDFDPNFPYKNPKVFVNYFIREKKKQNQSDQQKLD